MYVRKNVGVNLIWELGRIREGFFEEVKFKMRFEWWVGRKF